jgi:hypothetical protein
MVMVQKMIKCSCLEKRKRKIKMGSRQRYKTIESFLFDTQDTIEGVSDLGLITVLLRGENYNCFTHLVPLSWVSFCMCIGA